MFHFLGEVEVIFGLWALALLAAIIGFFDWKTALNYVSYRVNFTEPLFVVVIMTLAATRPILKLSEVVMQKIAGVLGGSLTAWWFTILTLGSILGSFITEPAAMTISALLISRKFYQLQPSVKFRYATLGLLFFLGFSQVTAPFQNRIDLKPPLLVGFFLGGLVVHGGVQGWWVEPVLGKLSEIPLMPGARIVSYFSAEFLPGPPPGE